MVGRNRHQQLDRLIEEVSRGERELSSIRDAAQREAVRIALHLHKEAAEQPDAYTRIRMRARVLGRLDARRPTVRDHAWTALELIARPAPYIVRGVALAAVLLCLGMGAIVASADTLPDDLLYPVKLSAEAVRLALADTPADRAVIEASIAEHRLHEAERLAANGRTTDALVASALYSQHIASAAAELAPASTSDLARQLEARFDADRVRAQVLATSLRTNAKSARAAHVLELIARPTAVPGDTGVVRVASTAAGVAEQLVQEAATEVATEAVIEAASVASQSPAASVATVAVEQPARKPTPGPTDSATAVPSGTPRQDDGRTGQSGATRLTPQDHATPTAVPTRRPDSQKANEALRAVKKAAEETRAAADRAKSQRERDREHERARD